MPEKVIRTFLHFQQRISVVTPGLCLQAIPAGLTGRGPLSHRMLMKHFRRSSSLLHFTLLIISPDCRALEVVVLCSEVLCFALMLARHMRALIPASIQITTGHVNRAAYMKRSEHEFLIN